MPVRSLNSSIMRWPDRDEVHKAICQWTHFLAQQESEVVEIGYFGSYARGDAGMGSDLDVILIVSTSDLPFERRAIKWDFSSIPVPVEASVYTLEEWQQLPNNQPRFYQTLIQEAVWLKKD